MAREFALFVQETAYQVPNATPVVWPAANANAFYARLDEGDSFSMRPAIVPVTIPYGGGSNLPAATVSDKFTCIGQYRTRLWASEFVTKLLLPLALQQVNTGHCVAVAGVTAGTGIWGSTEAPGNLASMTVMHAIQRPSDGSWKTHMYRGVKVDSATVTVSEESQTGMLTLQLTGATAQGNPYDGSVDPTVSSLGTAPTFGTGIGVSTFAPPGNSNLPIDPFLFVNTAHAAAVGSAAAGTAVLGNGTTTGPITEVASITVGTPGSAYVLPPKVTLSGGGGSGASAIAILGTGTGAGTVASCIVTSRGGGYTTAPTVTFSSVPSSGLYIGSERTTFDSATLTVTNNMMKRFWANRFVQTQSLCGRNCQLQVNNWYQPTSSSPDDRTNYEAIAAEQVIFGMNNGVHAFQMVMNNNSIVTTLQDHLPLADIFTQTMTIQSQFDPGYAVTDYALFADFQLTTT